MKCAKSEVPCHECKERDKCEILEAYLSEKYPLLQSYEIPQTPTKGWTAIVKRRLLGVAA